MLIERMADLDRQLADPGDDRLKRGDEREDDLTAGLHLELAGAPLCPASQPAEQLAGGFAAGVPWRLRNVSRRCSPRPRASRGWGSALRNASAICESTLQNTLLAPGQKQAS